MESTRTWKTFIHSKRKISSRPWVFDFYVFIFRDNFSLILHSVRFPHACRSVWGETTEGGGIIGIGNCHLDAPIWKHVERRQQNGTHTKGKEGLRTRELSIMHVPRPRCDWQINSMENVEAKKRWKSETDEEGNVIRALPVLCVAALFSNYAKYQLLM